MIFINPELALGLWLALSLGLGFRYYVTIKPTAFSLCVTITLQEVVE